MSDSSLMAASARVALAIISCRAVLSWRSASCLAMLQYGGGRSMNFVSESVRLIVTTYSSSQFFTLTTLSPTLPSLYEDIAA